MIVMVERSLCSIPFFRSHSFFFLFISFADIHSSVPLSISFVRLLITQNLAEFYEHWKPDENKTKLNETTGPSGITNKKFSFMNLRISTHIHKWKLLKCKGSEIARTYVWSYIVQFPHRLNIRFEQTIDETNHLLW